MKKFFDSFFVCISMYSVIPVPNVNWNENTLKYSFCFLPFIGAVIGGIEYGWYYLANLLGINVVLYAIVAAIIPVVLTGGIHMDALIDTGDAIGSHAPKERRLTILTDSNIGAFGAIYLVVYILILTGLFSELYQRKALGLAILGVFIISRVIGAFLAIYAKSATEGDLKNIFGEGSSKTVTTVVLILWFIAGAIALLQVGLVTTATTLIIIAVFCALYLRYTYKSFGGITGDLIGFAMSVSEGLMLALVVAGSIIKAIA